MKGHLIWGLDIGSGAMKLLLAAFNKDKNQLEVIDLIEAPSLGVRRAVIINPEKTSEALSELVKKAREETGKRVDSVYVNIGGTHLFLTSSHGTVAVSRADQKVSEEDVDRVIQAAQTFSAPPNKEILDIFPKEFILDGQPGIKEAVGLQGLRLETDLSVIGGFAPYKNNLTQAVLNTDVQVSDVIPSILAAASAVLSNRQKELGVALLDIGFGTTDLAVFEEGILTHLAVLPMGSANITNDIAIGLKTDIDTAELIKIKLGSCVLRGGNKKERIEIEGEEPLVFSQKTLARIIEARVSEMLGEVKKELKKIGKLGLLPAGLVITGGGAKLPGILELAKKEIKLPCRIGKVSHFTNLDNDPGLATVCGLILREMDLDENGVWSVGVSSPSRFKEKIKSFFKVFIP